MKYKSMKTVLLWGCLFCFSMISAKPLSPQQALSNAALFLNAKGKMVQEHLAAKAPCATGHNFTQPAYYVFDVTGGGFVVVSGDDLTVPVLGYSDKGTFCEDDMPEGLRWLLQTYAEQIGLVREMSEKITIRQRQEARQPVMAVRHNIEPLMNTLWNQGHPYTCSVLNITTKMAHWATAVPQDVWRLPLLR